MKYFTRSHRLILSGILAAAAVGTSLTPAHASTPQGPDVPATIDVDQGNKVFLVAHAVGVQIYPCNATAGGFAWGPTTPRANLFDDEHRLIGTHFGGPTWRFKDGSSVVARRVDGVTVDPTAIPWLLLAKTSSTAGADGDRLTNTTFIQRIATTGGLVPAASECNATTAGTTAEVPYTADYYFWKRTSSQ